MIMGIKRKRVEREEIRRRMIIDGVGNVVVVKINTVGVVLVNVVGMAITMEGVEEMAIEEGLRREIGHLQENLVVVVILIMAGADQALGIIEAIMVICMEGDHLVEVGEMIVEGDIMIAEDHHTGTLIMISVLVVVEDEMKEKEIFMVVATIMDPLLHLCSSKKRVVVDPFQAKVLEAIHVPDQDLVVILQGLDRGVIHHIRQGEAPVHIHVVILDPHQGILE